MVMEAVIFVPHKYLGQIFGVFKDTVQIVNENYTTEGCDYNVTFVPGDYDTLMADLNNTCKDEFDIKIVGAPETTEAPEDEPITNRGGKRGGRGGRGRGGKRNK